MLTYLDLQYHMFVISKPSSSSFSSSSFSTQLFYYADNTRGLIARVLHSGNQSSCRVGSNQQLTRTGEDQANLTEKVLDSNGLGLVQGLAVDWVSGNVLFSDSTNGTIMLFNTSSKTTTPILTGLHRPRNLTLYSAAPYR